MCRTTAATRARPCRSCADGRCATASTRKDRPVEEALALAIEIAFYAADYIAHHTPFLEPLLGSPEFDRVIAVAGRRVREFRD